MNTAVKGARNEFRSMEVLRADGYTCSRSSGSHGAWDIIAIGPKDIVLVQVKTGRWPRRAEMAAMRAFVSPPWVRRLIHRWRPFRRVPDVREVYGETA